MLVFEDYSSWLTPERLALEDDAWLKHHQKERQALANEVLQVCNRFGLTEVLEVGCGTGWLGAMLPKSRHYVGIDANPGCIALAMQRQPRRTYITEDLRNYAKGKPCCELVCCFSTLKHFGLHEWSDVLAKLLSLGTFGVFSLQLREDGDLDDGTEYHHVWISRDTFNQALFHARSVILREKQTGFGKHGTENLFVTRRMDA